MNLEKYDWKFKLFGIPVRVTVAFWLICVLFSPFANNMGGPWLFGLLGWSAAVFLSFLGHELGHALAIKKLCGVTPRIDLGFGRTSNNAFVFGGLTSAQYANAISPLARAFIALAGPLLEIALVVVFVAILVLWGFRFQLQFLFGFIPYMNLVEFPFGEGGNLAALYFASLFVDGFIWVGLVWGIFNLSPVYPMDGGQILLAVLFQAYGARGVRVALTISLLCAVALGFLFLKTGAYFMAFFLFFSAYQNFQQLNSRR